MLPDIRKHFITAYSKDDKLLFRGNDLGEQSFKNALEANLGSLVTCEYYVLKRVAADAKLKIMSFEVTELVGVCDRRGALGVEGVPARFTEVNGTIEIETDATKEQLKELQEKVAVMCPVHDLYRAAGVKFNVEWIKK